MNLNLTLIGQLLALAVFGFLIVVAVLAVILSGDKE